MLRIFAILLLITIMVGCQKQEVMQYDSADALSFYYGASEADSLSYSFATIGYGKQSDTLYLQMRVVGDVASQPRPVKLHAVGGSTARLNIDYKLPEFSVPANTASFLYPLVINKTPEMKTQILRLVLEVEPNDAFPGLAPEGLVPGLTSATNTTSINKLKIDFTDKLIKPNNWPYQFGTYSDVKYDFVIQVLGSGDFRTEAQGGTWTATDLTLAAVQLRDALITYEASHGILIDENGLRVSF